MTDLKNDPWVIFNYEIFMLFYSTYLSKLNTKSKSFVQLARQNAVVESRFLHLRVLTEILLSKNKGFQDDICLNDLIDQNLTSSFLKSLISDLKNQYGTSTKKDTPCWTLNKMLVHPSKFRGVSYNYTKVFDLLFPIIYNIVSEIHTLTLNEELKKYLLFAKKNLVVFK